MDFNYWTVLGIIAIIGLVIFYKKGAAWGGLTLGAIIGCIIAVYFLTKGNGFQVTYVKKAAIIGALLGIAYSFIQRIKNQQKNKALHEPHTL